MPVLLTPYKISNTFELKNRIIMAPLTRRRADQCFNPSELMAAYYAKRADAGLIISEGTLISKDANGYGNVPGIFTQEHIKKWQKITHAVHQQGGKMFLQLWHCGRMSNNIFHNGKAPLSASATNANVLLGSTGLMTSEAHTASFIDIQSVIADFAKAAINAREANFDGVEIHGANGYLIDQFLHECSNLRTDQYGITPDNMARFCLDIVAACGSAIGFERVGIRLSPGGHMADIVTSEKDQDVFAFLLNKLSHLNIAYVHAGNFDDKIIYPGLSNQSVSTFLRKNYAKTIIASGSFDFYTAEKFLKEEICDLVAFGRPFIANPNLVHLIKTKAPWVTYNIEMLNSLL